MLILGVDRLANVGYDEYSKLTDWQHRRKYKMREIIVEIGSDTVKFIRQPRPGKVVGKVSVIMFNYEILNNDVEAMKLKFQED